MTTFDKLYEALEKMQEAIELIEEASEENESLSDYYGYSLEIITQELNRFSDNSRGYLGRNTCLQDIIDDEGEKWEDLDED